MGVEIQHPPLCEIASRRYSEKLSALIVVDLRPWLEIIIDDAGDDAVSRDFKFQNLSLGPRGIEIEAARNLGDLSNW